MNISNFKVLPIFSKEKSNVYSGKKIYIGIGTAYYPKSRENIGVHTLNRIASDYKIKWEDRPASPYIFIEVDRVIMAKIKTWESRKMGNSVKQLLDDFGVKSLEDVIFLHSDKVKQFGTFIEDFGGNFGDNENMENVKKTLDTDRFGRIAIGVAPPSSNYQPRVLWPLDYYLDQEKLDQGFYMNRMTDEEEQLYEDYVLAPIKKDFYEQYLKQTTTQ